MKKKVLMKNKLESVFIVVRLKEQKEENCGEQ